jgi:hypothetical protein
MGHRVGMHELSAVLWRERELLDVLLYKLDVERLLLATAQHRWLGRAAHEIEYVTTRLKEVGLTRAVESAEVAEELGLDADATLRALVDATTDEVWQDILSAHLTALVAATGDIASLRDANERMLRAAAGPTPAPGAPARGATYDARGLLDDRRDASLVDEEV